MTLPTQHLKNKQRILIGGNRGKEEIFDLVKTVVKKIGKPVNFYVLGEAPSLTDAPAVVMWGGETLENGQAVFHQLDLHILVLHQLVEPAPEGYDSLESYLMQYERAADNLPKAGTLIFNESDPVATLIGKNDREDVKAIEYSPLKYKITSAGMELALKEETLTIPQTDENYAGYLAAAKALLNRIGVTDKQIAAALNAS